VSELKEFWEKANYPKDDERAKKIFKVIEYMEKNKILEMPLNYQWFVRLMYQLRKVIFV